MSEESAAPVARFERVLPSRIEAIAELAGDLERWGRDAGVPPQVVGHVNLMLDELVTNIVLYGYRGLPTGDIRVEGSLQPGALELTLTDHAFAYDPLQARVPDLEATLEDREVGGLGVHFVRTLADEVGYSRIDDAGAGANRLRIVKRF